MCIRFFNVLMLAPDGPVFTGAGKRYHSHQGMNTTFYTKYMNLNNEEDF